MTQEMHPLVKLAMNAANQPQQEHSSLQKLALNDAAAHTPNPPVNPHMLDLSKALPFFKGEKDVQVVIQSSKGDVSRLVLDHGKGDVQISIGKQGELVLKGGYKSLKAVLASVGLKDSDGNGNHGLKLQISWHHDGDAMSGHRQIYIFDQGESSFARLKIGNDSPFDNGLLPHGMSASDALVFFVGDALTSPLHQGIFFSPLYLSLFDEQMGLGHLDSDQDQTLLVPQREPSVPVVPVPDPDPTPNPDPDPDPDTVPGGDSGGSGGSGGGGGGSSTPPTDPGQLLNGDSVAADTLIGGSGDDSIFGGGGDDELRGSEGSDLLFGGAGLDVIYGGNGSDTISGGILGEYPTYLDVLLGNVQIELDSDSLYGGAGADHFIAFFLLDTADYIMDFEQGTDKIVVFNGYFELDRFDTDVDHLSVVYDAGADVTYLFNQLTGPIVALPGNVALTLSDIILYYNTMGTAAGETINGTADMESIGGFEGDDIIFGGGGSNSIAGGAGDDWIDMGDDDTQVNLATGNSGNDTIYGGGYLDVILGGSGDDEIHTNPNGNSSQIIAGPGADIVYATGNVNDYIDLNEGNDTAYGGDGDDQISGMEDDDEIYGEDGNDDLRGSEGNDSIYGGNGNDQVNGGLGDDYLEGNDGGDYIYGYEGEDTLKGGADNDYLSGGDDDDTLIGGAGGDTLDGNGGADSFTFENLTDSQQGSSDRIDNFEDGIDLIVFTGAMSGVFSAYTDFDDVNYDAGLNETTIRNSGNDFTLRFIGDVTGQLDDSDFIF